MKDISEVPSSFLIWIIEEYAKADWALINACKQELAARLKLDWTPKPSPHIDLVIEMRRLKKENERLLHGKIFFEKICWLFGIERIDYDKYWRSPVWLEQDILQCIEDNMRFMPYLFTKKTSYKNHMLEFRIIADKYMAAIREGMPKEDIAVLEAEFNRLYKD